MSAILHISASFFFNDTPTTEIYTLSLHDALPIFIFQHGGPGLLHLVPGAVLLLREAEAVAADDHAILENRSEEHTSELQSHLNLVCRLLLEKKKKTVDMRDQAYS